MYAKTICTKTIRQGAAAAFLLCGLTAPLTIGQEAAERPAGPTLTLAEAVSRALEQSPGLATARAAADEARGRRLAARTHPFNPELEIEAGDRSRPEGSSTDRTVALSQELEIAGQAAHRRAAAEAAVAAAEERLRHRRRQVTATVSRAFAEAVHARQLLAVARADLELTGDLLRFAARRLEAGAGTQIEVNLARAAAGRAAHRLQQAESTWWVSRVRLAAATGLDPATPPSTRGDLPSTAPEPPALDVLTRQALAARRDLAARHRDVEASRRRTLLERSLAVPNLRLSGFFAREEDADIAGAGLTVSIPLFQRNQGGIAEAEAAAERAEAELRGAELSVRSDVAAAYARWRSAAGAVRTLGDLVVASLEESLALLRRAVEAGELSATDVLLLRRDLVEGRREAFTAALELWLAEIDLARAVGADLEVPERESDANGDEEASHDAQ